MTIPKEQIEYIPKDLKNRLQKKVIESAQEYAAIADTIRVVVREVSEGEGWAPGTIFVNRYSSDSDNVRQGLRYDPN